MLDRRDFLKTSALLSLAPTIPAFLARTARAARPDREGKVLVVVQLDGGNDGINTVVPHADPGYARHRRTLRIPASRLVRVTDQVGLHPALANAGRLLDRGQLAIVQGVSYPNPNRSHFRSMAIWHSARLDPEEHVSMGWLGRALDERPGPAAASLLVGSGAPPVALRGRRSVASALDLLEDFVLSPGPDPRRTLAPQEPRDDLAAFVQRSMLDAYATADRLTEAAPREDAAAGYPGTALGRRFGLVARLLKANFGARVYYVVQSGYDTHAGQLGQHDRLLGELAGAVKAFLDDLIAARLADRVALLCFSEFGRTVAENGSGGTDHGTSGPVFLAGPRVRAGLVGRTPSLTDLDPEHGDLRRGMDFREVYATVLEDWLGLSANAALGGRFERLPLFVRQG
jgi:uncharacterized protein (DUF1501 family)